jgi:hypothetical protein
LNCSPRELESNVAEKLQPMSKPAKRRGPSIESALATIARGYFAL